MAGTRKQFSDGAGPRSPERRAFTRQSILALFGGVTITMVACSDDGSPAGPSPGNNTVTGAVLSNHGHTAVVTDAQVMAGNAVTLTIRGEATHPHTVELSAQEVAQIGNRQRVTKTSSIDNSPDAGLHSHTVTFN
jgi:hypothetical protein